MDIINIYGTVFILITLAGFYLAYLLGIKTQKFLWSRYVVMIIMPVLAILYFAIFVNVKILFLVLISCVVGLAAEYLAGLVYHKTFNEKLWKYYRLNIKEYTSWLSAPLWGIISCFFWFLSRMIGL